MAERTGFEPVEGRLAPHRFSKPAHSTTLPPLRKSNWVRRGIYYFGSPSVKHRLLELECVLALEGKTNLKVPRKLSVGLFFEGEDLLEVGAFSSQSRTHPLVLHWFGPNHNPVARSHID